MGQVTKQNLEEVMTYHAPTPEQQMKYAAIKEAAIAFAAVLLDQCPPCADTSAALRCVREAKIWANSAVALNGLI